MDHQELLSQLDELDIKPVDNAIIAARMDTPPPPVATGLAPPGAYDDQTGHDISDFELMQEFQTSLPEPAEIPDIQKEFRSNFPGADVGDEPSPENNNEIIPPGMDQ